MARGARLTPPLGQFALLEAMVLGYLLTPVLFCKAMFAVGNRRKGLWFAGATAGGIAALASLYLLITGSVGGS